MKNKENVSSLNKIFVNQDKRIKALLNHESISNSTKSKFMSSKKLYWKYIKNSNHKSLLDFGIINKMERENVLSVISGIVSNEKQQTIFSLKNFDKTEFVMSSTPTLCNRLILS